MKYPLSDSDVDLIRDALRDRIKGYEEAYSRVAQVLIHMGEDVSPEGRFLRPFRDEIKRCEKLIETFYLFQRVRSNTD